MPTPPSLIIHVPSRAVALLQFRRHVTNRLALAILADQRFSYVTPPRLSTDPTRPPQAAPVPGERPDIYDVRVEPLEIVLPTANFETDSLRLAVDAHFSLLPNVATRLTLHSFQGRYAEPGFQTSSTEPIYRYQTERRQFRRREGLSGDVVYLMQLLLGPHHLEIEQAIS